MASVPTYVVDRYNHTWSGAGALDDRYVAVCYHGGAPAPRAYAELTATRGPLRPIEAMPPEQYAQLRAALAQAGRYAVATLASALDEAFHQARHNSVDAAAGESDRYAQRSLVAGAPEAWESEILLRIVQAGATLNHAEQGSRRHPDPRHVDLDARGVMVALITDWVGDPRRYVELAQNLAACVSRYADEAAGPDGWAAIAEDWLHPDHNEHDFRSCYHLLYSRSAHWNPDLL